MFGIENGTLTVVIIIAIVVLFNAGLVYGLLSGSAHEQIEMLRRIARRARNPWEPEDRALEDLHDRVVRLPRGNKPNDKTGAGG